MHYIQRKGQGCLETVDQADTKQEANRLLTEYQLSDRSATYYISTRCCRSWRD